MARTIREHSTSYRKRYPERYEPACSDEIILDDATVREITPMSPFLPAASTQTTHMEAWANADAPSRMKSETHAFYREYVHNDCFDVDELNGWSFYNLELVKTLLLYGEMDIILRVCASPEVDLRTWHSMDNAGWDLIYRMALLPYIALNLIHFFPDTWDLRSGRTGQKDYRQMRAYLVMLKALTQLRDGWIISEIAAYPHWQFFGINQKDGYVVKLHDQPEDQRDREGVPAELVSEIMDTAEYGPTTARLELQHHPFHRFNEKELAKYVKYCWQLLIRCDMMATALGLLIPWHELISDAMAYTLIGGGPDGKEWFATDHGKTLEDEKAWTYTFLY
ncbi:hypothetical protein N657DRAFT_693710 [Parathielavia appendiculata]|uniref:Uncharacterized protein n=1 Tax=Parathielavia appendiculata TaxID=2587402 RepID=A0AAN6TRN3_9PEZI|nr:hypothetical protein N657DRAFT_693710 [Parathielavia appendiculata]